MGLDRNLTSRVAALALCAALPAAFIALSAPSPATAAAASCESLAGLKLDKAGIDAAQSQPAGAYTPSGGAEIAGLPAFCRVHGVASPVDGSHVGFEVWLPQAYERVQAAEDAGKPPHVDASADFYRLFLAPGLYHCQGGPGPNVLDVQAALEKWVEQGLAPETIAATKYRDDKPAEGALMSRPLCPYAKRAHYDGSGDPAAASSFGCVEGARYPDPLPAAAYLR